MGTIRIALSQINCCVGDIEGNALKVKEGIEDARKRRADIVCFPELAIVGYPPEDLVLKPSFIEKNNEALEEIVSASRDIVTIVGYVHKGDDIYNAAAIIHDGELLYVYKKIYLPNYGVFDENRYFGWGEACPVFRFGEAVFGVNICEDIWYPGDPMRTQVIEGGAHFIVNISSSPFAEKKPLKRERMLRTRAGDYCAVVAFCNLVGGQDELVFDGHSVVIDERGEIVSRAKGFEEDMIFVDIDLERVFQTRLADPRGRKVKAEDRNGCRLDMIEIPYKEIVKKKPPAEVVFYEMKEEIPEIFAALVLGTRDYVRKNNFKEVVIGISGGIDSSLVAAIAVEALGKENVHGVFMPSEYTTKQSTEDAKKVCENLGIDLITIPITDVFHSYIEALKEVFSGYEFDVTEENLQARIRGNILMALSNKFGWLVLTTGNKSEMSVGYATLYGDMAGGFAVIKDVPKTMVYRLCRYLNEVKERKIIPESVLVKPPSAELRPEQKDTDTLPEYELLDKILEYYIEEDLAPDDIVRKGIDKETVLKIIRMVDRNEYKRRQSPPGIKVTSKAFGKDRRLPITNRFTG